MSIDNYGELKTAVANWLDRSDLTSRVPEFIAMAEDRIGLDLRIRAMETTDDAFTIDSMTEALPTGFVGVQRFFIDGSRSLEFMARDQFWTTHGGVSFLGEPKFFTIEGENFVFGPAPDTAYTGKLLYYKKFTALSGDSDTNWLFTNARGLLLYGALLEAEPFLGNDPRTALWGTMYEDIKERVNEADRRDRHSEGVLVSRSGVKFE